MSRALKIFSICCFCLMLTLPAAAFYLRFFRAENLEGVEQRGKTINFSLKNILNGTWQRQIEKKFTKRSALFPLLVKSDNQLNLITFKQLSSNYDASVVLGSNNCLVEKAYIREANKLGKVKKQKLVELARDISELQRALKNRGIGFLLLISPSKPSLYPECLAPEWRVAGKEQRKNKYDIMLPLLTSQGINVLDAHQLFAEKKSEVPYRFFPDSGTHWGYYAACLVARQIGLTIASEINREMTSLQCDPAIWPSQPNEAEQDIAKLTNLWSTKQFLNPVAQPQSRVERSTSAYRPNVLFVGSSFLWNVLFFSDRHRIYGQRDLWYYFKTEHSWPRPKKSSINRKEINWQEKLLKRDFVVIEINEAYLDVTGFGFVRAALESLK